MDFNSSNQVFECPDQFLFHPREFHYAALVTDYPYSPVYHDTLSSASSYRMRIKL